MTDLLTSDIEAIAAVVVAVFTGLIAVDLVWRIIRKVQRREAEEQAEADLDAKLVAKYPVDMTEEQCKQMNAEKWNGD
jgi:hypothetical protein